MADCIHFLNTGASDCIIIESNGKFAMIDSGEDSDYPKNKPLCKLKGYEDIVCDYLLKNCANSSSKVTLEFIVGTHAHSDHIGGFDTIINHPDITVKKAFLKKYNPKIINYFERTQWDNQEVYDQMYNALVENDVEIIENFDLYSFKFENFNVTFFNGKEQKNYRKRGENVSSVVTLLEKNNERILLPGDFNEKFGNEKKLAPIIGEIDLLKVAHHCYIGSTSETWLKYLKPKYAVITNSKEKVHHKIFSRIEKMTNSKIYTTVDNLGIKAVVYDDKIDIETNIM